MAIVVTVADIITNAKRHPKFAISNSAYVAIEKLRPPPVIPMPKIMPLLLVNQFVRAGTSTGIPVKAMPTGINTPNNI